MAHPSIGVQINQVAGTKAASSVPTSGSAPQPTPDEIVKKYLNDHEFAPPEQQAKDAEQHALLDGRDMKLSDAEKQVAAATKQPADVVHRVLASALSATPPPDFSFSPIVGPTNEVPGIHIGSSDPTLQRAAAKAFDLQTLDAWLDDHGFEAPDDSDPTGKKALFDGNATTIDAVTEKAKQMLGNSAAKNGLHTSFLSNDEIVAHLRQRYVRSRTRKDNSHLPQIQVQYVGTPKQTQAAPGPLTATHQFTFQVVFQHGDSNHKAGFDLTAPIVSVTFDASGTITQASAGAQGAWVKPLLGGWLQAAGFVQASATVDFTKDIKGSTVLGSAGFQAVGGTQIALAPVISDASKFSFLSGHVQFGIQAQAGLQDKATGPQKGPAPIAAAGGFITLSF